MREIAGMVTDLVKNYETVKGVEINFVGRNDKMGFQTACFRFMVQLEDVIRKAEEGPFHSHIVLSPGEETAELHIFLGHGIGVRYVQLLIVS